MIIVNDTDTEQHLFNLFGIKRVTGRRSRIGWRRVSTLIKCPRRVFFDIEEIEPKPILKDDGGFALLFGKAIHEHLQKASQWNEIPIEKDGITGTKDMMLDVICEIKTTARSSRHSIESFTLPVRQLMCYLYMSGENVGKLIMYYKFGDYSRPFKPKLNVWKLTFAKSELIDNWELIRFNERVIEGALDGENPPPITNATGECGYCQFQYICYPDGYKKRKIKENDLFEGKPEVYESSVAI